jgi:hypothetical protein
MLNRDDVLDGARAESILGSRQYSQRFSALRRTLSASRHPSLAVGRFEVLLRLELQDRDPICGVDECVVLFQFIFRERSLVGTLREYTNPRLYVWRDAEGGHSASGLFVETAAQRVEQIIKDTDDCWITHRVNLAQTVEALGLLVVR